VTRRQALVFAAVVAICVGCDQTTKQLAQDALGGVAVVSMAGDAVRFELARNPGAFLSAGAGLPGAVRALLLTGVVPLALVVACAVAARRGFASPWSLIGLAALAGGGIGNWIDRLSNGGAVTDFVSLGVGPLRTGIFNFADVCIVAGAVVLVAAGRRSRRDPSRSSV